jgi:hypothetical protein
MFRVALAVADRMRAIGMVATRGPRAGEPAVSRLAAATGLA